MERSQPRVGSAWSWLTAALVLAFIGVTCWWLSEDLGVPYADAGSHLYTVVKYHDILSDVDVHAFWERSGYYPPATFVVGALATLVGGLNADAPIIGENVVYVSMLAIGCYGTGLLVAGPMAGFLAVLFVLGSPLFIEQMHVFMIDAPLAGIVAVSMWLVLLSDRFRRIGIAAAAGAVVGFGISSKEQFPLYVIGLLLVVLLRGGWRNWRGLAAFATVALVLGAPWYLINFSELGHYAAAAGGNPEHIPPRGRPPVLSVANLGWYLWALLNGLLFAPLFVLAAIGVGRTLRIVTRRGRGPDDESRLRRYGPELLAGLFVSWLAISLTPHHDMRYTQPMLPYLGVLATSWIAMLRQRTIRALVTAGLAAAVVATTLGAAFGVGGRVHIPLGDETVVTRTSYGIPSPNGITLYADHDFNISAPRREDDVQEMLEVLRRRGVRGIAWMIEDAPLGDPVLDSQGLSLFARFAGLERPLRFWTVHFLRREPRPGFRDGWNLNAPGRVFLIRQRSDTGFVPCVRLRDGSGLFFVRGDPSILGKPPYCPFRSGAGATTGPAGTSPAPRP